MASKPGTVEFIVEQMSVNNVVTAKKMFGEYGVYCGEKMVALVCDDELFVKPTPEGKHFWANAQKAHPTLAPNRVLSSPAKNGMTEHGCLNWSVLQQWNCLRRKRRRERYKADDTMTL